MPPVVLKRPRKSLLILILSIIKILLPGEWHIYENRPGIARRLCLKSQNDTGINILTLLGFEIYWKTCINGAVVQLGERLTGSQEVRGSTPLGSIFLFFRFHILHFIPCLTAEYRHCSKIIHFRKSRFVFCFRPLKVSDFIPLIDTTRITSSIWRLCVTDGLRHIYLRSNYFCTYIRKFVQGRIANTEGVIYTDLK